jgi:hypothetical protein
MLAVVPLNTGHSIPLPEQQSSDVKKVQREQERKDKPLSKVHEY